MPHGDIVYFVLEVPLCCGLIKKKKHEKRSVVSENGQSFPPVKLTDVTLSQLKSLNNPKPNP